MKRTRPEDEGGLIPEQLHPQTQKRLRLTQGLEIEPIFPGSTEPESLPTQIPDGREGTRRFKKKFIRCCMNGQIEEVKTMLGHPCMLDLVGRESFVLDTFQAVCKAKQKEVLDFLLSHHHGANFFAQDGLVSWVLAISRYSGNPRSFLPILSHPSHNFAVPRITLILCAKNCGSPAVVDAPFEIWRLIFGFLVRLQLKAIAPRHISFQTKQVRMRVVSPGGIQTDVIGQKGMPFWMIKKSFCDYYGLDPKDIDFVIKGQRVSARRTPQLLFHGFSATLQTVPALPIQTTP